MNTEIKKQAKAIFSRHPKVQTLYINPKGEFFTRKDLATNSLGKEESLTEVQKQHIVEAQHEKPVTTLSIADLSKQLEGVKQLPIAELLLKEELEGQNRKGAISAIEAKIQELKTVGDES